MLILSDNLITKYKQNLHEKKKQFNKLWSNKDNILNLLSNIKELDDTDRELIEKKIKYDLEQLNLNIEGVFAEITMIEYFINDLEVREK